ncbi:MAG TPA: TlyA family RNA methyltransferase, partial [Polyangiaceae bacterium]|nr:TlyA family RNA methyltransferase [Polyangiaceae bacterium]
RMAQAQIMAGQVLVGGVVCTKGGTHVRGDADIRLRGAEGKYASRGGFKLEAALKRFPLSAAGRIALDAGASTGGFTDCLLQHGAARVYAVDVGYGQLRGRLAADGRVVAMEKTNIADLRADTFDPPIDLCVFDLSYLSATKAAPSLESLFLGEVEMIGLIKPLYEGVAQEDMVRPDALREALVRVVTTLPSFGLSVTGVILSPIHGGRGSIEFLAHIREGSAIDITLCDAAIAELPYPSARRT